MSAMARRTSTAAAPTWGVRIAPRIRRRGWRTGRGSSGSVTSRAHRSRPERTSAVRASRSTIPPRATFTTVAPSGRRRRAARSRRPRVASVRPAARTRILGLAQEAREASPACRPCGARSRAGTYGSWTRRRGPKGRRRRAVSWPMRPKPRRPTVRAAQRLGPGALEVQPLVDPVRRAPQGLAVGVDAARGHQQEGDRQLRDEVGHGPGGVRDHRAARRAAARSAPSPRPRSAPRGGAAARGTSSSSPKRGLSQVVTRASASAQEAAQTRASRAGRRRASRRSRGPAAARGAGRRTSGRASLRRGRATRGRFI